VNQIFNKVRSSKCKSKREICAKNRRMLRTVKVIYKKRRVKPLLSDKYGRFPYCLSNQRNVFEHEVLSFLIKDEMKPESSTGRRKKRDFT